MLMVDAVFMAAKRLNITTIRVPTNSINLESPDLDFPGRHL
jgi:hypothetical protein